MFILPKLYVAGIQSGLRGLRRVGRRSRKELGVCISHSSLRVTLRRRTHDAATARKGESEDGHEPCDEDRVVQHGLLSLRDLSLISCAGNRRQKRG